MEESALRVRQGEEAQRLVHVRRIPVRPLRILVSYVEEAAALLSSPLAKHKGFVWWFNTARERHNTKHRKIQLTIHLLLLSITSFPLDKQGLAKTESMVVYQYTTEHKFTC